MGLLQLIKTPIKRISPAFCRYVRHQQWNYRNAADQRQLRRIGRAMQQAGHDGTISAGPFKGMRYVKKAKCSALYPKLLGCYEQELTSVVNACIARKYSIIIDIGCAEGYYAVGFALANPESRILAYDIDTEAQALCAELAAMNNASARVHISGECSSKLLNSMDLSNALVICDTEGAEWTILDPTSTPSLKSADILVEFHEFARVGITTDVISRFEATHRIEVISAVERSPDQRYLERLTGADRAAAVWELRPPGMQWAWMVHRSSADAPSTSD